MNSGETIKSLEICIAFYSALIILVFVHEVGHLLAGIACDFWLVRIRVGFLELQQRRWKLAWTWRDALSGEILMSARKPTQTKLFLRYFLFVLGGPVANIAFAFFATLLLRYRGTIADYGGLLVVGSCFLTIVNLIPSQARGLETDGMKLWKIVFNRDRKHEVIFVLTIASRLEEAKGLCEVGQFQNALESVEELVREIAAFPKLSKNIEFVNMLRRFQGAMRSAVAGETQNGYQINQIVPAPIELSATTGTNAPRNK